MWAADPRLAVKTPPCMRSLRMAGRGPHMLVPLLVVFDGLTVRMRSCCSSSGSGREVRTRPPPVGNALCVRRIVPSSDQLFCVRLQPSIPPRAAVQGQLITV